MKRICLGIVDEGRVVETLAKLSMEDNDRETIKQEFCDIIDALYDQEGESENEI